MLTLSFSGFDPERKSGVQTCCVAQGNKGRLVVCVNRVPPRQTWLSGSTQARLFLDHRRFDPKPTWAAPQVSYCDDGGMEATLGQVAQG
jgi:hypothetical protein